jgi:hypothetical protein
MNKSMRLVLVEWDDAWQDTDNFASAHGIEQTHKPLQVETLGWVILDDETGVSVVNEQNAEGSEFRGRTFIPRQMVRKVTDFTLARRRVKVSPSPELPADPSPTAVSPPK